MLHILAIVQLFVTFGSCFEDMISVWLTELNKGRSRPLLGISQHPVGLAYLRGFSKGIFGTTLFPGLIISGVPNDQVRDLVDGMNRAAFYVHFSVAENYRRFYAFLESEFCAYSSRYERWPCCDEPNFHVSCIKVPKNAHKVAKLLIDPTHGISLNFLYRWCIQAWYEYSRYGNERNPGLRKDISTYCPDPCYGKPCLRVTGVSDGYACDIHGPFEDDYSCLCDENHLWNGALKQCTWVSPCANEKFPACVPQNTHRCLASDSFNVICICKAEFMGPDCSLPRDACRQSSNPTIPNGYHYCQVQNGNECHPVLGTDAYTCVCKGNYAPLLTVPTPNCLTYRHICDTAEQKNDTTSLGQYKKMPNSIGCFNGGQCISSADGSHARCLCRKNSLNEPLHAGKYCEKDIGIWSAWSAPSRCLPTHCGRVRYKWRRRRCLNSSNPATWTNASKWDLLKDHNHDSIVIPEVRCAGTSEEVLPCSELDECKTLRLPSRMREEIIDYKTLFYFLIITGVQIFISVVALCIAQNR